MDMEDNVERYKKILADHRQEQERRYHVSSLGQFGSRLCGDYRENSKAYSAFRIPFVFVPSFGSTGQPARRPYISFLSSFPVQLARLLLIRSGLRERLCCCILKLRYN